MRIKFFFAVEENTVASDARYYKDPNNKLINIDSYFPGLDKYTLTNIYDAGDKGIDFFYDYTDFMNSYVKINEELSINNDYIAYKVPLVRYKWWNTEEKAIYFFSIFNYKKDYIEEALILLEDSFGVDYKLFNTYGRSMMYNIEDKSKIDRVDLSLKFEIKFKTKDDISVLDSITQSIKDYIEDMNDDNITDLHIPNLCTYIRNIYANNLVYFKFIKLNEYNTLYQSIYKDPKFQDSYFKETQTVPEFLNVSTRILNEIDNEPDITYIIKY
jgi:hypothetical protein